LCTNEIAVSFCAAGHSLEMEVGIFTPRNGTLIVAAQEIQHRLYFCAEMRLFSHFLQAAGYVPISRESHSKT